MESRIPPDKWRRLMKLESRCRFGNFKDVGPKEQAKIVEWIISKSRDKMNGGTSYDAGQDTDDGPESDWRFRGRRIREV